MFKIIFMSVFCLVGGFSTVFAMDVSGWAGAMTAEKVKPIAHGEEAKVAFEKIVEIERAKIARDPQGYCLGLFNPYVNINIPNGFAVKIQSIQPNKSGAVPASAETKAEFLNDSGLKMYIKKFRSERDSVYSACSSYRNVLFAKANTSNALTLDSDPKVGAAKAQLGREYCGDVWETRYSAAINMIPGGFSPGACSGTYPTKSGSYSVSGGNILGEMATSNGIQYSIKYGKKIYPLVVVATIGDFNLVLSKPEAQAMPQTISISAPFIKYDGNTKSFITKDFAGNFSVTENHMLQFVDKAVADCMFIDKKCASHIDILIGLQNNEVRKVFLKGLREFSQIK